MEKGKFISNSAFYPLMVLFCVLFSQIWVGLLILGFVIVMEKNPKITASTLHSVLWFFVWPMYRLVIGQVSRFYDFSSGKLADIIDTAGFYKFIGDSKNFFGGFNSFLFFAFIILVIFLGVMPLLGGKESKLPFKKAAEKFVGSAAGE